MDEEMRRRRRQKEARRRRRRKVIRRRIALACCLGILLVVGIRVIGGRVVGSRDTDLEMTEEQTAVAESGDRENGEDAGTGTETTPENLVDEGGVPDGTQDRTLTDDGEIVIGGSSGSADLPFAKGYAPQETDATVAITSENVQSSYALLVDLDENTIAGQKNAYDRISPASMTKILTVLVAAEHVTDLDDTFTITREITDYSYSNDASAAGFAVDEVVTVRDLMYGTILPSGADAAAGLAMYVAGSLDDFVGMMNEKLDELGLSDSAHFTNCVGFYDDSHYCSIYDMAMILKAAVENDLSREVLTAHIYTTSQTEQHPDGIELSNWFLRRIEDKDTHGEVVCAKTGYVLQSGNCAASYAVTESGKHYICVTANAHSAWRCIYDHVAVYQEYTK
ncbi:MAG: serine hydrolase [Clostridiales bacterium]|nr:serine hydrolase [Clostridiales bacterium]